MASLFGFSIDDSYKKPSPSVVSPVPKNNEDGADYYLSSGFYGQYLDVEGVFKTEYDLLRRYREMALHPEVDGAIEDIISEAIVSDQNDSPVQIDLENLNASDKVKNIIRDEFQYIKEMLDFDKKSHEIFRNWYVDGKIYNVRVKAINALGVSSTYTSANRTIVGATDTPADVSTLSVSMVGSNQMQLQWTPVTDLDVSYYAIRYQDVTSNASWAGSTNLTQVVRRKSNSVTINARTGAFLIKAVDKLGNESDNETIVYSNISGLEHFSSAISTINEESASAVTGQSWNGTFDGDCVKGTNSDNVQIATLDTITLFDSTVGNFDSAAGDFDLGGTDATSNPTYYQANIESSGSYIGSNTLSLDATYDATFQATVDMIANDLYDLFDSGRGASLFDNATGPFDGSSGSQCDAFLQVGSSTSSLGAISTYQDISQQSTIKGRYFKFRLKLTTDDNKVRPEVSKMQVKLVLEKRLESGEDIASLAGAKAITYTNAFYASPAVGIAAQNMATGDYYVITSKTKTGFTITFYNSGGAAQDRNFDFVSKGYGLKS